MSKIKINIKDIFNISSSEIYNPDKFIPTTEVGIDSRKVKRNSIFFAIKGENFDGHKFVNEAISNGAATIIINKNRLRYFDNIDCCIVTVKNTTSAYGELANIVRNKAGYKVVSLTGSNGKTGTKEMLNTILSQKHNVACTSANNNNHIGVPLTIFSADKKTEILILEHGTNHFGEIDYTAKIAEPDLALITNIGNGHLEFLENIEKVYSEKAALFNAALAKNGYVFINNDDKMIRLNSKKLNNKISFGFKTKSDIKGSIIKYNDFGYPEIKIEYGNKKIEALLPLLGEANAKNLLASVAVALSLNLNKREILSGIRKLSPVEGRLFPIVGKDNLIIDDTYNSNPESVIAAISALKRIKKYKNKVIILGDMLELGAKSSELHKSLAKIIIKNKSHELILFGKYMKKLYNELKLVKSNIFHSASGEKMSRFLSQKNFSNSAILVKGSRGMEMEKFLNIIRSDMK